MRPAMAQCTPAAHNAATLPRPHFITADIGGGPWTGAEDIGVDSGFNVKAGGGILVSSREAQFTTTGVRCRDRHWSLYLGINFLFTQSGLAEGTANQVATSNPQNPTLLSATSGRGRYYALTMEPTFRYRLTRIVTVYALGGFGLLKRTLDFTGMPPQGTIVQGPSAVAASFSGASGVFDAGGGISFGPVNRTAGVSYYIELRRLQGLGVNGGTTLWPAAAGIRW
jgi:hypothetical protein